MLTTKVAVSVLLIGGALAGNGVVQAQEARGQAKGEPTVGGSFQGIDSAKNTITVTTSNRATGKVDKTYELSKELVVLRDGKPAKAGDLKKGSSVSVK